MEYEKSLPEEGSSFHTASAIEADCKRVASTQGRSKSTAKSILQNCGPMAKRSLTWSKLIDQPHCKSWMKQIKVGRSALPHVVYRWALAFASFIEKVRRWRVKLRVMTHKRLKRVCCLVSESLSPAECALFANMTRAETDFNFTIQLYWNCKPSRVIASNWFNAAR